jgi:hypothetical protein
VKIPLSGHTSFETAYVVDDYPYGFRLRCKIKYWIETKPGFGSRVMSSTTNPKKPDNRWNKPKASTYAPIKVLYLDSETGHVENAGLSAYDAEEGRIEAFEAEFGAALTERDKDFIAALKRAVARVKARNAAASAEAASS